MIYDDIVPDYKIGNEDIASSILNFVKIISKMDSISVEDIKKIASINAEYHKSLVNCIDKLSVTNMNTFVDKFKRSTNKDTNGFIKEYFKLINSYTGKAKQAESSVGFGAIYEANKKMASILDEIYKNADQLFDEKFINVYNIRISSVMVFSILRQSDLLSDYSTIMYTEMINIVNKATKPTTRYKINLILNNTDRVAEIINSICAKDKTYTFLKEQENLKRQNNDLLLYVDGNIFTKYLPLARIKNSINLATYFIPSINFIAYIAKKMDDYAYEKYLKQKALYEWMVNYTAVLKLELNETDPSSPEYQKLLSVIQAYEDKLAKHARVLEEYEKGD